MLRVAEEIAEAVETEELAEIVGGEGVLLKAALLAVSAVDLELAVENVADPEDLLVEVEALAAEVAAVEEEDSSADRWITHPQSLHLGIFTT